MVAAAQDESSMHAGAPAEAPPDLRHRLTSLSKCRLMPLLRTLL